MRPAARLAHRAFKALKYGLGALWLLAILGALTGRPSWWILILPVLLVAAIFVEGLTLAITVPPTQLNALAQKHGIEGVGPAGGAIPPNPYPTTETELAQALQRIKYVESLDRIGGNRAELEAHISNQHSIPRDEQRRSSIGVTMAFHEQSHRELPQSHPVTDLS